MVDSCRHEQYYADNGNKVFGDPDKGLAATGADKHYDEIDDGPTQSPAPPSPTRVRFSLCSRHMHIPYYRNPRLRR